MSRHRMPKRKDRRVFTRTAAKAKKININPTIFRGGIRL
ncbi:DNA binding protein [Sigmofec virus UA08Rod_5433]|uniref:DNA binding protein n=1 Tax=Sigmofec virus UA08Rod_5433 TaxID=2929424 RepID=A0A976R7C9_9VIRU|nr:DNA binding protein [Sigmofec virus UA08Rod_5433]